MLGRTQLHVCVMERARQSAQESGLQPSLLGGGEEGRQRRDGCCDPARDARLQKATTTDTTDTTATTAAARAYCPDSADLDRP
jgi:hypothetical protein